MNIERVNGDSSAVEVTLGIYGSSPTSELVSFEIYWIDNTRNAISGPFDCAVDSSAMQFPIGVASRHYCSTKDLVWPTGYDKATAVATVRLSPSGARLTPTATFNTFCRGTSCGHQTHQYLARDWSYGTLAAYVTNKVIYQYVTGHLSQTYSAIIPSLSSGVYAEIGQTYNITTRYLIRDYCATRGIVFTGGTTYSLADLTLTWGNNRGQTGVSSTVGGETSGQHQIKWLANEIQIGDTMQISIFLKAKSPGFMVIDFFWTGGSVFSPMVGINCAPRKDLPGFKKSATAR